MSLFKEKTLMITGGTESFGKAILNRFLKTDIGEIQAEAVCELFGGKKEDIKVIGIRHGEKMYEIILTNEECAKAVDMGNFYRVPADNRGLNYDKYFKDGGVYGTCHLTY